VALHAADKGPEHRFSFGARHAMALPMVQTDGDNRARTLKAARDLFFQKGFAQTSTSEIARRAGTSKSTLYSAFGSMEGLLRAVIESEVNRFGGASQPPIDSYASFRAVLIDFCASLLAFLNQPETIHFARLMQEQARHQPRATDLYFNSAYLGTAREIDRILEAGAPFIAGTLRPDAADRFVAMLKGSRFDMAVLGLLDAPFPDPEGVSADCVDWAFPPLEPAPQADRGKT